MAAITPPRPLAATDDRYHFDCGRVPLDEWFRRNAWHYHASGVSRTNVVYDTATGETSDSSV